MFLNLTNKKFTLIGFSAALLLLIFYFVILSLANSFSHAFEQFSEMWYWILILAVGFGLQVGLYFYIRASFRLKQMASPTTVVVASGGISSGSMVACCLHHLVDVLPLMGLAAVAVFLTQYQLFFIILGILANIVGIIIMLEIVQKHNLSEGFLKRVLIYDMGRTKKIAIAFSSVLLLLIFFTINSRGKINVSTATMISSGIENEEKLIKKINLPSKTDSQHQVSFEVMPVDFSFAYPVKFEIRIDTHSGSLDFEMTEISVLEDDLGKKYQPLEWQGSAPGGHHRSGVLVFPELDNGAQKMKLVISDILPRNFEWDLNLK